MSAASAHLRIARPSNDLAAAARFYGEGLGFEALGGFQGHAGYDGVMLGRRGAPYHLEFTRAAAGGPARPPSPDDLLVFYVPDEAEWTLVVGRLTAAGHRRVPAENPYWDARGATFEDPDGYRVVIQNAAWP